MSISDPPGRRSLRLSYRLDRLLSKTDLNDRSEAEKNVAEALRVAIPLWADHLPAVRALAARAVCHLARLAAPWTTVTRTTVLRPQSLLLLASG